jgi:uncharacterized protein (TIGR02466 family)
MTQKIITETYPLFSQPVFLVSNDETPHTDAINFVKSLESRKNAGGNYSTWRDDILNAPEMSVIKNQIVDAVSEFTNHIMGWTTTDFYITQSWGNINPKDTSHHIHYHYNSIVSGTYYLATGVEDHIVFYNDPKPMLDFEKTHFNIYNASSYKIPIKTNTIAVFPSTLMHSVEENKDDWERISIAFNVFVKGPIGSREALTYLEL